MKNIKQKAWGLIIDGKLDIHYDLYSSLKLAKEYKRDYRSGECIIVEGTFTYTLPTKKKS